MKLSTNTLGAVGASSFEATGRSTDAPGWGMERPTLKVWYSPKCWVQSALVESGPSGDTTNGELEVRTKKEKFTKYGSAGLSFGVN